MKAARLLSQALLSGFMAVAGSGCGVYAGMPVEGSFDRTLAVSGTVDLEIRSGSGGIRIDAGPVDTVHVVARIRANPWFSGDTEARVRRIEANPPILQNGNIIAIGRNGDDELFRNVSIGYDVTVPEATRVRSVVGSGGQRIRHVRGPVAATAGSGGIQIEDAAGVVEAVAGSGGIVITGAQAAVRARTGSGGIRIEGKPLDAWDLQTGSGGIRMSVTDNTPFNVDARTGSGGISSDHQPVAAIGVTTRHRLQGTVRGGGALVQLQTGSGGIHIE
jgi:hypothetical protein